MMQNRFEIVWQSLAISGPTASQIAVCFAFLLFLFEFSVHK